MPEDRDQLLRDVLTANRVYVCREIELLLLGYIEESATEEEVPGIERALELVKEYRAGKPE